MIDLRSDTVTAPTPGMYQAMTKAPVGDDVFGDDPTVNAFQEKVAVMFGMEAGLFVPSGTMSNQLGLNVITNPTEEVIADETAHIFNYETGAAAHLSSIQIRTTKAPYGVLTPDLIRPLIRTSNDWDPITSVIALENSTNKGGGFYYTRENMQSIRDLADEAKLSVHLDGARIWNASVASGVGLNEFGAWADTISVCFSKGLGAPAGSMLLSSTQRIKRARRMRKMLGGGMRQVGIFAAAAEYAVDNHMELLQADHAKARRFAEFIDSKKSFSVDLEAIQTNIVLFDTVGTPAAPVLAKLKDSGVWMVPFKDQTIRATFHFQISDADLSECLKCLTGCLIDGLGLRFWDPRPQKNNPSSAPVSYSLPNPNSQKTTQKL